MKNYIQPGENLTLAMPAAVASGGAVLIGAIFGVAQGKAEAGDSVVLVRRGVFELPKLSAEAWSAGDPVYWDDTAKQLTTVEADALVGAAVEDAANPSETGIVLLDGVIRVAVTAP
ncbi:DUF2190 family protein [Paracoccus saliphilus]|uniref:DUF2190 family protein n=1 Tax=Paracoccus saliphilus TaxID=405559 RepID=A0AA45W5Z2_9RHOB|nr:capsid cement protein [Paracoccus saliphilus]WCR01642.1 DUF2190 family protein [Paracoccus saliphilus]SIS98423.1 Predicted phage recombinase, RecA/RadA family [Paracoccus saliphilus]